MGFVVLEELLLHKVDQQITNIRFHILAIWWVEPYNLSVSGSSSVSSFAIIWVHRHSTYTQKLSRLDTPASLYAVARIWVELPLCVRTFYIFTPLLINFYSDLSFRNSQFSGYFYFYLCLRLKFAKPISKRFIWCLFIA